MIEKIIAYVVSLLMKEQLINEDEVDKYVYGYTCLLENIITIISILFISILKGNLVPMLFFLSFFFLLRGRTGGYHLNSFVGCFIGTISICILVSELSALFMCKSRIIGSVIVVFSAGIILVIGTVNHPNMQMNRGELQESKKLARITVVLELLAVFFLSFLKVGDVIVCYSSYAIILCALLMIIAKVKKQEVRCERFF